jgi:hypothetical protein
MQSRAIPRRFVLCHTTPHRAVLCHTTPFCAVTIVGRVLTNHIEMLLEKAKAKEKERLHTHDSEQRVASGVEFLSHPQVRAAGMDQKVGFLEEKVQSVSLRTSAPPHLRIALRILAIDHLLRFVIRGSCGSCMRMRVHMHASSPKLQRAGA